MKNRNFKSLLLRLLKYAKPYSLLLSFCLILVFLSTAADLVRPYLIKLAIDDNISGLNSALIEASSNNVEEFTIYKDLHYERVPFDKIKNYNINSLHQIVNINSSFYFIDGYINKIAIDSINFTDPYYSISNNGEIYKAHLLSDDEYKSFRKNDLNGLTQISIFFLFILFASVILNYGQIFILNFIGQKIIYTLRADVFKHIQSLSLSFFNKNPVGKLVTRTTNDMNNISELFTSVLVTLVKDFLLILGTIVVMLKIDAYITLICLSTLPLLIIVSLVFRKLAKKSFLEVKKRLGMINTSLNENITGMSVIQLFGQEKKIYDSFKIKNNNHYQASIKQLLIFAIFRPSMNVIYTLTLCLLIWFGGGEVIQGKLAFGVLFAFINYTDQLFRPIFDLSEKFNIMESAMASSERVFQILDTDEKIPQLKNIIPKNNILGKIEFENVSFAYDDKFVLENVSFVIEPGETIAFVGATGSGKTTIISLLTRLYDIQKGRILIDGYDIKSLNLDFLRKNISSVLQDVFLFSGDIKSNIRLGNNNISIDDIINASKFVNADNFISKLEDTYDHEVVENGATLSSGQKQLISFARAIAFNPSILILDEATSNIDTETELLIQDAISKLIKDRTTIVVAHRLSTIQHANKIIVLNHGKIKEIGSHYELLNQKGMYYDLYKLQYENDIIAN